MVTPDLNNQPDDVSGSLMANLDTAVTRIDALIERTEDMERLRVGLGIRLALGMAQELRDGKSLGSETGVLVAEWSKRYGQESVDLIVGIARGFLLKPQELRSAFAERLGLKPEVGLN